MGCVQIVCLIVDYLRNVAMNAGHLSIYESHNIYDNIHESHNDRKKKLQERMDRNTAHQDH
jgi:hypothetical protein